MRILLAASDRDLLESYQKLLTDAFGECVTAFDGTQVLADLAEERFDMVVLDRALPRVRHAELLRERYPTSTFERFEARTGPFVTLKSLPDYDAYNAGRYLFASRILPYIDKQEGLNTTATNPYYHE